MDGGGAIGEAVCACLGNQMVSELLVKTIARRGYMLAVGKDTIKMI